MKHLVVLRLVLRDIPQGHGTLCSHMQRTLHTSIEGSRVKRDLAAGCLSFWLLLLGQARKSNSPVGAKPDAAIRHNPNV